MSETVPTSRRFEAVARTDALTLNSMLAVVLANGERVCLVRTAAGVCALADRCSHRDFPLSSGEVTPEGLIECAWHGARFDPFTGVMLTGPGGDDVKTYEVQVDDKTITIAQTSATR